MSKKQFGVWMDTHSAIVAGRENVEDGPFVILHHAKSAGKEGNSNENAANNREKENLHKFFKEITTHMQNAEVVHVSGPGTAQEQFINYLAETPQFKNTKAEESTSTKMSDEKFVEFITGKFN